MSGRRLRRISLDEIEEMHRRGELHVDPNAPEGPPPEEEPLGEDFWRDAMVERPKTRRSVHLKLDADVFDFFHAETKGKGHLTRMQDVLRSYVAARRKAAQS
jgi:BrnA antitoxin of type II toxin-antitoxin system